MNYLAIRKTKLLLSRRIRALTEQNRPTGIPLCIVLVLGPILQAFYSLDPWATTYGESKDDGGWFNEISILE